MATVKLPHFGEGFYRIGGLLFEDGVATDVEITPATQEIIDMLGAEVEDGEQAPAEQPAEAPADEAPATSSSFSPPASDEQADAQQHEIVTTDSDTDGHSTDVAGGDPTL